MKLRWSSAVLALVLALGFLVPAPASAATTYSMSVVSGNFQTIFPTETFAPLVIKVSNSTGQPVANRSVLFEVLSGPGTIGTGTYERKLTGVDGRVTLTSLKGTGGLGTISFRATTDNAPSLSLSFSVARVKLSSRFGDQQILAAGAAFQPIYTYLRNDYDAPLDGVEVTFTTVGPVTFQGGRTSAKVTTDVYGRANSPAIPAVAGGGVGYVILSAPGAPSTGVTLKSVSKPAITASGSGQTISAGAKATLRIVARDDNGVNVSGHRVTYRITAGSSAVSILPSNGVSTSSSAGYSDLDVRAKTVSTRTVVTIQATSPSMSPVNFTVTVTP